MVTRRAKTGLVGGRYVSSHLLLETTDPLVGPVSAAFGPLSEKQMVGSQMVKAVRQWQE